MNNLLKLAIAIFIISNIMLTVGCQSSGKTTIVVPKASSSILKVREKQHKMLTGKYSHSKDLIEEDLLDDNKNYDSKTDALPDNRYSKLNSGIEKGININYGDYYALVIGNNDYQLLDDLETAKKDAVAVGNILQKYYGFRVKLLLNATRADILTALNQYRTKLTDQDNLLVYYAGHGWLDKEADEGYWMAVDSKNNNPVNWVSNSSVTNTIKAIDAKHILIVADSCFSGKLTRDVKVQIKKPNYLIKLSQKKARNVMTSGGLETVLDSGGRNKHSVFASAFIDALLTNKKKAIDTSQLFPMIRQRVMLNADQTPEYSDIRKAGHDGGDFIFIKTLFDE